MSVCSTNMYKGDFYLNMLSFFQSYCSKSLHFSTGGVMKGMRLIISLNDIGFLYVLNIPTTYVVSVSIKQAEPALTTMMS